MRAIFLAGIFLAASSALKGEELQKHDNAADYYRRAAQGATWLEKLPDAERDPLFKPTANPRGEAARQFLSRGEELLNLVHDGNKAASCDWKLSSWDHPEFNRPLVAGNLLVRLGCLRAAHRFAEGQHGLACDDILAVVSFSRRIASAPFLNYWLLGQASEHRAHEVACHYLLKLSAKERAELLKRLDALPAVTDAPQVMRLEKEISLRQYPEAIKKNPSGMGEHPHDRGVEED
jgi:hypothetical protein